MACSVRPRSPCWHACSKIETDGQSLRRREALVSRAVANCQAGIGDEEELASASKLPLGR
ncbi:hypothetical protein FJ423_24165 [Mesorhizobium sp. B2-8-9]|nr:hypothetical protein FJ423_24165 [Mesorhizobium sp. B2-8-9]